MKARFLAEDVDQGVIEDGQILVAQHERHVDGETSGQLLAKAVVLVDDADLLQASWRFAAERLHWTLRSTGWPGLLRAQSLHADPLPARPLVRQGPTTDLKTLAGWLTTRCMADAAGGHQT